MIIHPDSSFRRAIEAALVSADDVHIQDGAIVSFFKIRGFVFGRVTFDASTKDIPGDHQYTVSIVPTFPDIKITARERSNVYGRIAALADAYRDSGFKDMSK